MGYLFVSKNSHMQYHWKLRYLDKTGVKKFDNTSQSYKLRYTPGLRNLKISKEYVTKISDKKYKILKFLIKSIGLYSSDTLMLATNRAEKSDKKNQSHLFRYAAAADN